jgi:hypothetical protein
LFDVLALVAALAVYRWLPIPRPHGSPQASPQPWQVHPLYIACGSLGATLGAYVAGSANLWLSGIPASLADEARSPAPSSRQI